jgi:tetratricopeptide (TPR) repeat protein
MKPRALIYSGLLSGLLGIGHATAAEQSPICRNGLDALAQRDYRGASQQLTQCLQLDLPDPVRAFILRSRARAYAGLDYPSPAVEDQKASLKYGKPYDVWPFVILSAYQRSMKNYDASLEALKQALAYDEDGPGSGPGMAVFYHTGLTLNAMNKRREAIEALDKGIAKQANYGFAYYARAVAYEALSNRAQAKLDLTKAAELIPSDEYSRALLAKFKEYGVPPKRPTR